MSFDLYFVRRPPDGDWESVLFDLEEQAGFERALSADDLETWRSIDHSLRSLLPSAEIFEGPTNRELTDAASGIQLSMHPGELSLSVPYWYSGSEAESMVAVLRQVVEIIEGESGLVAFDPQAESPFLATDASAAVSSFDKVQQALADQGVTPGEGEVPQGAPTSGWRRMFRRKR